VGGAKSLGPVIPAFARAVATNVSVRIIPDAGHWLEDESPRATNAVLLEFLK